MRIYERSPMRRLERATRTVVTDGGSIRADRIILALNAWASQLPELRRTLLVIPSDVIARRRSPSGSRNSAGPAARASTTRG